MPVVKETLARGVFGGGPAVGRLVSPAGADDLQTGSARPFWRFGEPVPVSLFVHGHRRFYGADGEPDRSAFRPRHLVPADPGPGRRQGREHP